MKLFKNNEAILSAEQVEALVAEVRRFGVTDEGDLNFFRNAVTDQELYWGGVLEWTERGHGFRVVVHRYNRSKPATDVLIYKHGYSDFTDADYAEATKRVNALFA